MSGQGFPRGQQQQPDGAVRQSQIVTTFGPGSMLDLLNDAVLVGGLDFWNYDKGLTIPHIDEPRLRDAIVERFRQLGRELSQENPFRSPPAGNDREPTSTTGIQVLEFSQWFVCQNPLCRALVRKDGLEMKKQHYWHACQTGGKTSSTECVPVRFVLACPRGHADEFPWIAFAHEFQQRPRCASPSLTFEEGATGDFNEIRVHCACGGSGRMADLLGDGLKLHCRGERPWLGPQGKEECLEDAKLLVRTASNSYFPQVVSALSIPDPFGAIRDRVREVWDVLKSATKENLPIFRQIEKVRVALDGLGDAEVLRAIQALSSDKPAIQAPIRTAEYQQLTTAPPELHGDLLPLGAKFFARTAKPRDGLPTGVGKLVVVPKLREVVAQIGFTRLEPVTPDVQGEYDLGVKNAALGLTSNWLPASEIYGEGVFLELDEEAVRDWEDRDSVKERAGALCAGYDAWASDEAPPFPGVRFYMLHSLAHLLMSAISLECGYAGESIRERIYCGPSSRDPTPMAAILLSTGTSGTEGTLGGLVEQGRQIREHLQHAFDLGRLCSNDPVCATHSPEKDHAERFLEGAACHGCLFVAECSCERFNRYLDRALVVPALGHPARSRVLHRTAAMTAPVPLGLSRVPLPVLVQLLEAIEQGRIDCPITEADLQAGGFGALSRPVADALQGCDLAAASAAIRLVVAERVHRPPPRLNLVWTGPESWASVSRDTSMIVRELFVGARRSVIVGGYAFDKPEILEPLHRIMVERGVTAQLFMDVKGEAASVQSADAFATEVIDTFFRKVWTFGSPKPDVFYDPRTAVRGPPWASLHAKCIVVDEARTLITSANFTERGQTRNIEAGVLIEDRGFAEELGAQWRQLITARLVHRYAG